MINNDVLRSLRYMLDISDEQLVEIVELGGYAVSEEQIAAVLKKDDEPGLQPCSDELLAHALDGLVYFKRGKDDSRPTPPLELPVSNNQILKKLRVAFELRDDDLQAILQAVDLPLSKSELNALFRKPGHSNYRVCGDQLLRNVLKGLAQRAA